LNGYGRIQVPSVEDMLEAYDEAPSWDQGEEITLHDLKQLYIRSGIAIAFWDGNEPQKELSADAKAALRAVQSSSGTVRVGGAGTTYSTTTYSGSSWHRKEKGIRIHVDSDSESDTDGDKNAAETNNNGSAQQ